MIFSIVGNTSDEDRHTKLSLTIIEANNIAYSTNVITKNHYCTVLLGDLKCRTPSVKAKCWPTWNFKVNPAPFPSLPLPFPMLWPLHCVAHTVSPFYSVIFLALNWKTYFRLSSTQREYLVQMVSQPHFYQGRNHVMPTVHSI